MSKISTPRKHTGERMTVSEVLAVDGYTKAGLNRGLLHRLIGRKTVLGARVIVDKKTGKGSIKEGREFTAEPNVHGINTFAKIDIEDLVKLLKTAQGNAEWARSELAMKLANCGISHLDSRSRSNNPRLRLKRKAVIDPTSFCGFRWLYKVSGLNSIGEQRSETSVDGILSPEEDEIRSEGGLTLEQVAPLLGLKTYSLLHHVNTGNLEAVDVPTMRGYADRKSRLYVMPEAFSAFQRKGIKRGVRYHPIAPTKLIGADFCVHHTEAAKKFRWGAPNFMRFYSMAHGTTRVPGGGELRLRRGGYIVKSDVDAACDAQAAGEKPLHRGPKKAPSLWKVKGMRRVPTWVGIDLIFGESSDGVRTREETVRLNTRFFNIARRCGWTRYPRTLNGTSSQRLGKAYRHGPRKPVPYWDEAKLKQYAADHAAVRPVAPTKEWSEPTITGPQSVQEIARLWGLKKHVAEVTFSRKRSGDRARTWAKEIANPGPREPHWVYQADDAEVVAILRSLRAKPENRLPENLQVS